MAQAIVTKYFGYTNSRGARIQVKSWRGTKYYSYDYEAKCAHRAAFDEWMREVNREMAVHHKDCQQAVEGNWYKRVSQGNNPCGTGYTFIIE